MTTEDVSRDGDRMFLTVRESRPFNLGKRMVTSVASTQIRADRTCMANREFVYTWTNCELPY